MQEGNTDSALPEWKLQKKKEEKRIKKNSIKFMMNISTGV